MVKIRDGSKLLDSISHLLQKPFNILHISLSVFLSNIQIHRNIFRDFAEINDRNCRVSISLDVLFITSIVVLSEVIGESILAVVEEFFEGGATMFLLVVQIVCIRIVIWSSLVKDLGKICTKIREFKAERAFP